MTHVYVFSLACEEPVHAFIASAYDVDGSLAVLSAIVRVNFASVVPGNLLETVADAEHGHASIKDGWVDSGCSFVVHAVGRTREDDTAGLPVEIGDALRAG